MWPFRHPLKTEITAAPTAEERSLADPTASDFSIFGITASASGATVTPATALAVPAVMAGVAAISQAVGILPLHAYARDADGARERDPDQPAFRLLNCDASPWMRGPQLRELMTADAIAYGNGFALITRDSSGEARELHRLHPSSVSIEINPTTAEPIYRRSAGASARFIPYTDILHLRAPATLSMDAICGRSPLLDARDAIGLLITLSFHASKLFANGGRPSGILSFPQKLGAEAIKKMKASWQALTVGSNAGGTAVLEEGGSFTPLAFSSVDAQFMEIWALAIIEVARVLRVPPVLLMDYSRQTWANAETGGQQFLTYTLAPWLARWEAEITLKLIAPEDRDRIFVEHLTDALLKSDFASRATAFGQYRSMGVMTANEVRASLNLAPLPGGDTLQNPYTTTTATDTTEPATTGDSTDV